MTSTAYSYTSTSDKLNGLKNHIMQGPVSIAVFVNSAFSGYSSGIFDSGCGTQANHAVTAIGWGPNYFDTINSWGSHWGDNGKMKMSQVCVNWYQYPGTFSSIEQSGSSGWNSNNPTPASPTPASPTPASPTPAPPTPAPPTPPSNEFQ